MKQINLRAHFKYIVRKIRFSSKKVFWSLKYYGFDLTILGLFLQLLSFMGKNLTSTHWYKTITSSRFDKRFRVDTAGYIIPEELDISIHRKQTAVQYQPTASVTFPVVISELPINYSDYVFIDYGSGKGRSLLLASHFPFKQIIGVELSNKLHQIAEKNMASFLKRQVKCRNRVSVCEDATAFTLPKENLIIYFFRPFNREILTLVLNNIRRSLEECFRHIIILYYYPEQRNLFSGIDYLRKINLGIEDRRWEIYESIPGGGWELHRNPG